MITLKTPIPDLSIVETNRIADTRGAFSRLFCEQELSAVIGKRRIVQINFSRTTIVGTVRGVHFQRFPYAEMKLVRCIKGRIWDVAVDLREKSKTFLQWHAEELSPDNGRMLVVPEGFAHGFQVLEPDSELIYLHTAIYHPQSEGGVRFNDPQIGINWPNSVTVISDKDANYELIDSDFQGLKI